MKKLENWVLRDSSEEELMTKINEWTVVSIDTETTGNFDDIFDRRIVMLQLGDDKEQFLIDCRVTDPVPFLKRLVERDVLLVGHNLKFDYTVIKLNYGIEIEHLFDTMLGCQLVEYQDKHSDIIKRRKKLKNRKYTLEACVQRHVSPLYYSSQANLFAPVITKQIRQSFSTIGDAPFTYEQEWYGLYDVLTCFCLYKKLSALIEEHSLFAAVEQENEFLKVAADCEINGMPLDAQKWMDATALAKEEVAKLRTTLLEIADINWDSPKQVNEVLKGLGVDTLILDKKTGEIKESVGRNHLQKQTAKFPTLATYIEYKIQDKKCKAYGENFLRHVNPQSGRVHTSFLQLMDTGRTSSNNPNLQNIPRKSVFRAAFHTGEDSSFVVADFSNQEMRVLADFSKDTNLLKAFETGSDIHLETAKITFQNPNLTKESEERQWAKSINFLIAYGGGAKKLSENFGVALAQAKEVLKIYMTAFSGLEPYFKRVGKQTRENGYIYINDVTGRRAPISDYKVWKWLGTEIARLRNYGYDIHPKYKDIYSYLDSKLQRASQNYMIQGTSADISKWAGIYLRRYSKKIPFKLLLLIHDEWVLECPNELTTTTSYILEKCCKEAVQKFLSIPIPAVAVVTKSWTH